MPVAHDHIISAYFPADAWERNNPKVLETAQGMLLFGDYSPRPDGTLELAPVTLIYWLSNASSDNDAPLIVQAPGGAVLHSDRPINLARAELGRPVAGRLVGQVIIRRPRSRQDRDDELYVTARHVQIDRHRLWTPNEVEFRLGPHWGRGRDLQVRFHDHATPLPPGDRPFAMVRELQLSQLEKIVLKVKATMVENAPASASSRTDSTKKDAIQDVELRAAGPFRLYLQDNLAVLSDGVQLTRRLPDGPTDQLRCDMLEVRFQLDADQQHPTFGEPDLHVHRILAKGKPVELDFRSADITAQAELIEWVQSEQRLIAESAVGARLTHANHTIRSIRLDYTVNPTDPRLPGVLTADGPGTIQGQLGKSSDQTVTLSWENLLQLRPYEGQYVLSASGKVKAVFQQLATISAAQVFLFLHVRPDESPSGSLTPASWKPDRLIAQDNVLIDSRWLKSRRESREFRVWFVGPEQQVAPQPVPPAPVRADPVPPRGEQTPSHPLWFQGDVIEAQVVDTGSLVLDDITVAGDVLIATDPASPGNRTLLLRGDLLRVSQISARAPRFQIQGQPAQTGVDGLTIESSQIALDAQRHRLWSVGQGQMRTPATLPSTDGEPTRPLVPLTIRWTEGMECDGRSIFLHGDVHISGRNQLPSQETVQFVVEGRQLRADLDHPVSFDPSGIRPGTPADLRTLWLQGPIRADSRTWDEEGKPVSWEQLTANDLRLDKSVGTFEASGPGECHSVRMMHSAETVAVGISSDLPQSSPKLTHIRVQYGGRLTGNVVQREVEFQQAVVASYVPVPDWSTRFDPQRDPLGAEGLVLTCDTLKLAQMASGPRLPPRHEILAVGNVAVRGGSFSATGNRLSYDDAKDLLVLEGTARQAAVIRTVWGSGNAQARVIRVWPKSRRVQSEGIQGIDFGPVQP